MGGTVELKKLNLNKHFFFKKNRFIGSLVVWCLVANGPKRTRNVTMSIKKHTLFLSSIRYYLVILPSLKI